MKQNDLNNLKSAITFELGMTLSAMSNLNKYSANDLMDAYSDANHATIPLIPCQF